MTEVNVLTAFVGGLATFFAPCSFVFLPTFLSFLASRAVDNSQDNRENRISATTLIYARSLSFVFFIMSALIFWGIWQNVLDEADPLFAQDYLLILVGVLLFILALAFFFQKTPAGYRVFASALAYVAGFMVVFIFVSMALGFIGNFLRQYQDALQTISGFVIVFFGLIIVFQEKLVNSKWQFLYKDRQVKINPQNFPSGYKFPFTLGMSTALVWGSCVAPIFGAILALSSWAGSFYLFIFGMGMMIPFLILAIFVDILKPWIMKFNYYTPFIYKATGIMLIVVGLSFIMGRYTNFASWLESLV